MKCQICLEHESIGKFRITDYTIDVIEDFFLCQRCINEMKEYDVEIKRIEKSN